MTKVVFTWNFIYGFLDRSPCIINILSLDALLSSRSHNIRIHATIYFLFGAHLDSREHCLPLTPNCFAWIQKNKDWTQPWSKQFRFDSSQTFVAPNYVCVLWCHNMAADIPFMEVTGRKDVQNGGHSISKMTTGFGLFLSLSKVKIYFFLLFTSNLSCFNSFKLPYKIRLLGFRSPLNIKIIHFLKVFPILLSPIVAGECH